MVELEARHLDAGQVPSHAISAIANRCSGEGLDQPPLLPRVPRDHHQHPVQAERGPHVDRRDHVADVDRIERAPEDTDAAPTQGPSIRAALFTLPF